MLEKMENEIVIMIEADKMKCVTKIRGHEQTKNNSNIDPLDESRGKVRRKKDEDKKSIKKNSVKVPCGARKCENTVNTKECCITLFG